MRRDNDTSLTASLASAADENLHVHMRWVQERTPGMHVRPAEDLLIVDSGLPTDTFNFISQARLQPDRASARIAEAISYFDGVERPFSWWVGLTDSPAGLGMLLENAGLRAAESETAMSVRLKELKSTAQRPSGLTIERVRSEAQLEEYAKLLSVLWDPPDESVVEFYRRAAAVLFERGCPIRLYLGILDSKPVATAEVTLSNDAAGLYNISTSEAARGRGIGSAMTSVPLLEARDEGCDLGVLQAAATAVDLYRRLGFRELGRYIEYQR